MLHTQILEISMAKTQSTSHIWGHSDGFEVVKGTLGPLRVPHMAFWGQLGGFCHLPVAFPSPVGQCGVQRNSQ